MTRTIRVYVEHYASFSPFTQQVLRVENGVPIMRELVGEYRANGRVEVRSDLHRPLQFAPMGVDEDGNPVPIDDGEDSSIFNFVRFGRYDLQSGSYVFKDCECEINPLNGEVVNREWVFSFNVPPNEDDWPEEIVIRVYWKHSDKETLPVYILNYAARSPFVLEGNPLGILVGRFEPGYDVVIRLEDFRPETLRGFLYVGHEMLYDLYYIETHYHEANRTVTFTMPERIDWPDDERLMLRVNWLDPRKVVPVYIEHFASRSPFLPEGDRVYIDSLRPGQRITVDALFGRPDSITDFDYRDFVIQIGRDIVVEARFDEDLRQWAFEMPSYDDWPEGEHEIVLRAYWIHPDKHNVFIRHFVYDVDRTTATAATDKDTPDTFHDGYYFYAAYLADVLTDTKRHTTQRPNLENHVPVRFRPAAYNEGTLDFDTVTGTDDRDVDYYGNMTFTMPNGDVFLHVYWAPAEEETLHNVFIRHFIYRDHTRTAFDPATNESTDGTQHGGFWHYDEFRAGFNVLSIPHTTERPAVTLTGGYVPVRFVERPHQDGEGDIGIRQYADGDIFDAISFEMPARDVFLHVYWAPRPPAVRPWNVYIRHWVYRSPATALTGDFHHHRSEYVHGGFYEGDNVDVNAFIARPSEVAGYRLVRFIVEQDIAAAIGTEFPYNTVDNPSLVPGVFERTQTTMMFEMPDRDVHLHVFWVRESDPWIPPYIPDPDPEPDPPRPNPDPPDPPDPEPITPVIPSPPWWEDLYVEDLLEIGLLPWDFEDGPENPFWTAPFRDITEEELIEMGIGPDDFGDNPGNPFLAPPLWSNPQTSDEASRLMPVAVSLAGLLLSAFGVFWTLRRQKMFRNT